jgi:hypothetical protein
VEKLRTFDYYLIALSPKKGAVSRAVGVAVLGAKAQMCEG